VTTVVRSPGGGPRGRRSSSRLAALVGLALLLVAAPVRAADVDGDGRADVVWRSAGGLLKVWRLVAGSIEESTPSPPPPEAEILGLADVSGDGRSELVWTLADDQLMASSLDGSGQSWSLGPLPPGRFLAWADVDGDGRAEALVLAGQSLLELWRPDPLLIPGGPVGLVPAGADLVAAADVDASGTDDLLWQHPDGALIGWLMAGTSTGTVVVGHLQAGQRVAGLADVDGDGQADLVIEALDGGVEVWLLQGGHRIGGGPVGNLGPLYHVPLVGDLDGDGRADVALRHQNGQPIAWLLDGATVASEPALPAMGPEWQVVPAQPRPRLRFQATSTPDLFLPTLADVDRDGWLDALGTRNTGAGVMELVAAEGIGLGALFADGRAARDARVADLNGDGLLDLVANTYSAVTDPSSRALLFFGNGDGTFVEDPAFAALDIRGYGETIVVADFDNDGDLDVYIPYYAFNDPEAEHSYLLINDGTGHFTDIADAAGVALRGVPLGLRPEGAQAVDLDGDGWIDLYVASHLFRNNGDLTFTDIREASGLPQQFEEGAKLLDWNQDGRLDLVLMDFEHGPRLYESDGIQFHPRHAFAPLTYLSSYGLNVADLDGDGREDVITGGACDQPLRVHLNSGARLRPTASPVVALCGVLVSAGDLDGDRQLDVAVTAFTPIGTFLWTLLNRTPAAAGGWFAVEVVGPGGEQNQHGRVIRAWPASRPDLVMTRIVDSGSGYLSQGAYPVLFRTPYLEKHVVQVGFAGGLLRFTVTPGESVRVGPQGRLAGTPGALRPAGPGTLTSRPGLFPVGPAQGGSGGSGR
jgi:hypothetical protein